MYIVIRKWKCTSVVYFFRRCFVFFCYKNNGYYWIWN